MATLELAPLPWKAAAANREIARNRGPLLLVTSAQPSLETHLLDGAVHPNLGRLIQPRHTSSIERTAETGMPWAADNDCFQALHEKRYVAMLDRIAPLAESCLFVTVPDVVADAVETARRFDLWAPAVARRGLPSALVAQDGLEDLGLWLAGQWHRIDALFIGGSTEWKESQIAIDLADEARARGKWVHWGRVNTKRRFDLVVADHGDSFDGSKFARFRKTYLDGGLEWARVASDTRFGRELAAVEGGQLPLWSAGKGERMTPEELQAEIDERNLARNQDSSASWRGKVALGEADSRPGRYYVTAKDAGRTAFLLGPFVQATWGKEAHARALGEVRRARRYLDEAGYARAAFFAYGTSWIPLYGKAPVGKLNEAIGGTR